MLAIASTFRLCECHGLKGPIARELKSIARRELGFIVALHKNSWTASTRLSSKIKLSVYGVRY
jgi:hypothetical protein